MVYVKKEWDIETIKIKWDRCYHYIWVKKEENKKLKDYADNLDSENDNQAIEIEELKKEQQKRELIWWIIAYIFFTLAAIWFKLLFDWLQ